MQEPDPRSCTLIVFARAPVPGACKTRLIGRYGAIGAARLHRRMLERSLRVAREAACGSIELWVTPPLAHPCFTALRRREDIALRRQCAGDLGRRMAHALAAALRRRPGVAVLIGTDAADLCAQDLRTAAQALARGACEAFLQPALDGGFVLIATRRDPGALLQGVRWSSGRELAQTCARFERRGLRVALGAPRRDIDRPADVRAARHLGLL
jgi:uncharacterized protein